MSFTKPNKPSKSAAKDFVPKPYQKECIRFGISRPAAGFFLAPGLGKTSIILFLFRLLKKAGLVDELFVLAKKRIVYEVWPKENRKWNGLGYDVSIVHGSKKLEALKRKADIYLMNYEGLPWLVRQQWFFRRGKRIMLACDESSKLRHTRTVRFKRLRKILPKFDRRYILTGSPAPSGLMNLFGQVYALDLGKSLGAFITHYRNQYFLPTGFMGTDWKPQPDAEKRIFKKLKPLVIRYGEDQLDLPPLTFVNRFVTLPKKARKIYDDMEQEFVAMVKDGEITAANAAVASGKCRQIANGHIYVPDELSLKRSVAVTHDEKCEELVELLEELNGEPALVGYEYNHDMQHIKQYIKKNAPQFKSAPFIGGHTNDKQVSKYIEQWERGDHPVMFGQISSTAYGLNLQGKGGIVIFFSLTWSLEDYEQFIRRVWRQGQTRRVIVYRIIARNTVDIDQIQSLKKKDATQQTLLRAMERRHGIR